MAYFGAGRYEEADAAADRAIQARPTYPPGLRLKVATCGLFGRIEEGLAYVRRLLVVHPECSISWIRDFWGPLMQRSPEALAKFIEGFLRDWFGCTSGEQPLRHMLWAAPARYR